MVPVILFHAGVSTFSGGFVGVDIFFVISGYLITSILIEEIDAGSFSLVRFYERRARRILPALFFVMALCIPFAFAWMLPVAFKDFSQSLGAIALFSSNVLFWLEADYFAEDAEEKPLLHTWSLAVEEQYYVLFPLFLLLLWRAGRRNAVLATALLALVSLFLSELGWRLAPVANFYLLPTRAWELLAGSLCAFWMRERPPSANGPLALLGLGMILYSILVFNAETPFPSLHTLLPVGGAALVILYGEAGTLAARVLSARPMVGVGLVSYSAYLWHQPLFAFARIRSPLPPEPWVLALLAAASFPLAYLTWRYVERPFRARTPAAPGRRAIFAGAGLGVLAFVGLGLAGQVGDGFPARLPPEVLQAVEVRRGDTSGCLNRFSNAELLQGRNCKIGAEGETATIALLGDSHAAAITDAFGEALESWSLSALTFSGSWCAPLMDFGTDNAFKNPACRARMNAAFRQVMANGEVETVILFAQWPNYVLGRRWNDRHVAAYTFDGRPSSGAADNAVMFEQAFLRTIETLEGSGKKVFIVASVPEYEFHVRNTFGKSINFGTDKERLILEAAEYKARNREVAEIFSRLRSRFDVAILDTWDVFCGKIGCDPISPEGEPLYMDGNHLGYVGGKLLSEDILGEIVQDAAVN